MAKSARGGKREGAGRKKGAEQTKITFWVDKEALDKARQENPIAMKGLRKQVEDLIKLIASKKQ